MEVAMVEAVLESRYGGGGAELMSMIIAGFGER